MLGRWDEALARVAEIPEDQLESPTPSWSARCRECSSCTCTAAQLDEARRAACPVRGAVGRSSDIQGDRSTMRRRGGPPRRGQRPEALAVAEYGPSSRAGRSATAQASGTAFLHALEAALAVGDSGEGRGASRRDRAAAARPALPVAHRHRPPLPGSTRRRRPGRRPRVHGCGRPAAGARATLPPRGRPARARRVAHRAGATGDAEPFLAEARETFGRLGATPWLERAAAKSAVGARRLTLPAPR